MEEQRYLNTIDAAAYIRNRYGRPCSPQLLTKLSCKGGGPVFVKIGRFRSYRPQWLDEWVLPQISEPMRSTSDTEAA
jgi:hypothetical protein